MAAQPRTHNSDGRRARGNSNGNLRGGSDARRRRRAWLLETYAADIRLIKVTYIDGSTEVVSAPHLEWWLKFIHTDTLMIRMNDGPALPVAAAEEIPTARCYRCGILLHDGTITVDQIKPKALGGTYRRENIRPACGKHNSSTGAHLGHAIRRGEVKKAGKRRTSGGSTG